MAVADKGLFVGGTGTFLSFEERNCLGAEQVDADRSLCERNIATRHGWYSEWFSCYRLCKDFRSFTRVGGGCFLTELDREDAKFLTMTVQKHC